MTVSNQRVIQKKRGSKFYEGKEGLYEDNKEINYPASLLRFWKWFVKTAKNKKVFV